jgi:FG-GAP repeat
MNSTRFARLATAAVLLLAAIPISAQGHTVFTVDGFAAHDLLGFSVDGVGDLNRDGRADLAAGCFGANKETGEVRIYSGATVAVLFTFVGDSPGDRFGYSVAGAGDVNRDGYPDIIVGACRDDDKGTDAGSARIFSGKNGAVIRTLQGTAAGDEFGTSVAAAGDVNRDGYADVIVGAPLADANGTDSGRARVFSGKTGAVLYAFAGDSAHDWYGYSVSGAGDVNRDGYADLIVGVTYDDSGTFFNNGSAKIYSGRNGALLRTFRGLASSDWFGLSVASAGDVNGDRFDDVIVGASSNDTAGKDAGMATIFSGRDGRILRRMYGENAGDEFGVSVRGCGDFDGDRRDDVVVGAYRGGSGFSLGGSVYVFSGRNGKKLLSCYGEADDNRLGVSVAGAGDVTGDGRPDVIAGAVYADRTAQNAGAARVFTASPMTLMADVTTISLATGGTQSFVLDAGSQFAGLNYRVIGSATGTSPGINFGGGFVLPITYDSYSRLTLDYANYPEFTNFAGTLDPRGRATASLVVPTGVAASAIGLTLYHGYVAFDNRGRVKFVSNAVAMTFTK